MSSSPKKASDVVNNFGIVLIGLVTAILLWVSVVALQAYYSSTAGTMEQDRLAADQGRQMREIKAAQTAQLQEWKWVDQNKGVVTLGIDQAMALVVRDAKAGAPSLVPAVGPHDKPTVPAEPGRPADNATVPATPATPAGAVAPAGAAPAGAAPAGAAPAGAAPAGAAPAAGGN